TVILVDRSHSRFPVKADFVGLTLSTNLQEHIEADFSKKNKEAVYLT
ncbi:MAG: phosphoribosyltransferase, partial [Sphingobacteriia bacterium]|nr:phosphoribosyltransferase [Sphingobacteriia bacterium]